MFIVSHPLNNKHNLRQNVQYDVIYSQQMFNVASICLQEPIHAHSEIYCDFS